MSFFFEDQVVGASRIVGSHTFTREEIIAFARAYDPQAIHLDDAAGVASIHGSLIASGWHAACVWMRLLVVARKRDNAEAAARGETIPPAGLSPGVKDLRWPAPVRPGDTITYTSRIASKRETRKPQWGLVFTHTTGVNQHGVEVYSASGAVFSARRPS
jgi:acyl dehydratase